jgi:hypothetical protein
VREKQPPSAEANLDAAYRAFLKADNAYQALPALPTECLWSKNPAIVAKAIARHRAARARLMDAIDAARAEMISAARVVHAAEAAS